MSETRKILMIGPDSQGGITSVIDLYIENGLADSVIFLASYKGGSLLSKLVCYFIFWAKYLYLLVFNKNLKIVHIHSSANGSFLRKLFVVNAGKLFNKKVIMHLHSPDFNLFYDKMPKLIQKIITYTLNVSDVIIALSSQCKLDIAEKCTNKNIRILYNPTKLQTISHKNKETIDVLFMGIIGQRKGAYDIVKAGDYITNPNIKITMHGDGEVEELKNEILGHKFGDIVFIKGWISGDKKDEVFQNADIYILPSYSEGLPMSILEAMAYGLPVISTPVGGTPEAVEDGVNGFLIKPGDYVALAEKIDLLANDKPLRDKMGEQGYRIAKEKFDINVIVKQLKEMYEEISEPIKCVE